MFGRWIPEETPILESVFMDYARNADDVMSDDGAVGVFDSWDRSDDYVALNERVWSLLNALDTISYHAGLERLRSRVVAAGLAA